MWITNHKYTSDGLFQAHTSMIPSGSIPSGPPWSFELWERANFPSVGGKFTSETQSWVFGGPVYAQKISLLAANARVKHRERGQTTCFTSKSQLRNPETIAHRRTPTTIRINPKIRRFGARERVRQRVLNMEFSFLLLANMSDNQACAL